MNSLHKTATWFLAGLGLLAADVASGQTETLEALRREAAAMDFYTAPKEDILKISAALDRVDGQAPVVAHGASFGVGSGPAFNLTVDGREYPLPKVKRVFSLVPPGSKARRLYVLFRNRDRTRATGHYGGVYVFRPASLTNTWDQIQNDNTIDATVFKGQLVILKPGSLKGHTSAVLGYVGKFGDQLSWSDSTDDVRDMAAQSFLNTGKQLFVVAADTDGIRKLFEFVDFGKPLQLVRTLGHTNNHIQAESDDPVSTEAVQALIEKTQALGDPSAAAADCEK